MKLKKVGFFRGLEHGDRDGYSLKDAINTEPAENEELLVKYLESGAAFIVSPGLVSDILSGNKDIIGNLTILTDGESSEKPQDIPMMVFQKDDVAVHPAVSEYDYQTASQKGEATQIQGVLPGATEGVWYIIETDGIEYYFGKGNQEETGQPVLYGYSVMTSQYAFKNGLSAGRSKSDILAEYTNIAEADFDGNILNHITGCMGWNGAAYPHSYAGMDGDLNYNGKAEYRWSDQFDTVLLADIEQNDDESPVYIGLLIKDDEVKAITFFHPTAD